MIHERWSFSFSLFIIVFFIFIKIEYLPRGRIISIFECVAALNVLQLICIILFYVGFGLNRFLGLKIWICYLFEASLARI